MKSQKGSISVYLLCFLPLMLGLIFAVYLYFTFTDSHLELTQSCLAEQIQAQEKVKRSLRTLFNLNPKAASLRVQYRLAQAKLYVALQSGTPPAIMAAQARVTALWNQRRLLDLQQKALIQSTDFYLASHQQQMYLSLQKEAYRRQSRFSLFAKTSIQNLKAKPTKLAVTPDSKDLAPVYNPNKNFLDAQALEVTWNLNLKSHGAAAIFLPVSTSYPQSCSTTINIKEDTWPTVTREVKSLSKPLS